MDIFLRQNQATRFLAVKIVSMKYKLVVFGTLLGILCGAFGLSQAQARKDVSTKVRSCQLWQYRGYSPYMFKIKFNGYKNKNVFKIKSVSYLFSSYYDDKSNINIFTSDGKKIWRSPDSMKASDTWEVYKFKKERAIPMGKRFRIYAIGDVDYGKIDHYCLIKMRLSKKSFSK